MRSTNVHENDNIFLEPYDPQIYRLALLGYDEMSEAVRVRGTVKRPAGKQNERERKRERVL